MELHLPDTKVSLEDFLLQVAQCYLSAFYRQRLLLLERTLQLRHAKLIDDIPGLIRASEVGELLESIFSQSLVPGNLARLLAELDALEKDGGLVLHYLQSPTNGILVERLNTVLLRHVLSSFKDICDR